MYTMAAFIGLSLKLIKYYRRRGANEALINSAMSKWQKHLSRGGVRRRRIDLRCNISIEQVR
jgi:hypothetical protein